METSIALARIFGLYLTIIGISLLLNPTFLRNVVDDLVRSHIAMLIIASTTLILGCILIVLHNHWTHDWRVFITLFCWLVMISGILRTLFPKQIMRLAQRINVGRFFIIVGALCILMGAGFLSLGFNF